MRKSAGEIARLIELAIGSLKVSATQLIDQIQGSQVAPATGSSSGAVQLSDDDPTDIGDAGTADPGTDGAVSRGDHVHALPVTGVTPGTYGDSANIPVITVDAEGRITVASETAAGGGTVTSVGLVMPSAVFDVSGSPITGAGNITVTLDNQSANTIFAGPNTGSPAAPAFRALVADDIPNIPATKISGTATRIPYFDGSGFLTSEANFEYIAADDELRVNHLRLPLRSDPNPAASGYRNVFVSLDALLGGPDGLLLPEIASPPGTPASGFGVIYLTSAGIPVAKDDGGILRSMVRNTEGNWTPTVTGSGTAGTFTYDSTNTKISWERIGNKILFNGRIIVSATSVAPTGNLSITGLPTAAGANSNNGNILGAAVIGYTGVNLAAGYTQVHGIITGGATTMLLYEMGDNVARAIVQGGELASAFDFFIAGWYKVD